MIFVSEGFKGIISTESPISNVNEDVSMIFRCKYRKSNLYEDLGMIFVFVGLEGFLSTESPISNVNEEVSMIFKCKCRKSNLPSLRGSWHDIRFYRFRRGYKG